MKHNSHKTAIVRGKLSAPARWLEEHFLIDTPAIDFGCGRGEDAEIIGITSYDPYWRPVKEVFDREYRTVLMTYVLNTLPTKKLRKQSFIQAQELLAPDGGFLYVTVRRDMPASGWGWNNHGTWQGWIKLTHNSVGCVFENDRFVIFKATKKSVYEELCFTSPKIRY